MYELLQLNLNKTDFRHLPPSQIGFLTVLLNELTVSNTEKHSICNVLSLTKTSSKSEFDSGCMTPSSVSSFTVPSSNFHTFVLII